MKIKYNYVYSDIWDVLTLSRNDLDVKIPLSQKNHFIESIKPSFEYIVSSINIYWESVHNYKFLKNFLLYVNNFSPEFLKKLTVEIHTLNRNQLELFLENINYNLLVSKKANPLFDILRIKKGVLTKKILSKKEMYTCIETYSGFIRALKAGTVKIITLKIDGENKTLLVKSLPGNYKLKNFRDSKYGTFTLALDITNFNIYSFINVVDNKLLKNKIYNIRRGNSLKNFNLIEGFADYENVRKINKSLQERHILKKIDLILSQVEEIKKLLLNYKSEKISKRNDSFKKSVKKMLSDKKTKEIIKKRFKK
jgi:hypothetical protein